MSAEEDLRKAGLASVPMTPIPSRSRRRDKVVTILGTTYELTAHPDGRPGYECWPTKTWAWPGILR